MSGDYQQPPPQGNQQYPPPDGQPYQHPPGQHPPPSSGKKGPGKAILIILVVAIVIFSFIAMALFMSPGLVGKWVLESETLITGDTQLTNWKNDTEDWIEFKKDGTGTNSDGEHFNWEIDSGQLIMTGVSPYPVKLNYTLENRKLTLDITPLLWAHIAAAAEAAGIEGGIGGATLNLTDTVLATYRRI